MNPGDERTIRQRLHTELDSVEISPAPINSMTRQGKAIRARRRALAGGAAAVAVAAVLAARFIAAPGPEPNANTVTLNAPNPSAPGGVFASGTADGKPWRLAVRNIADPGTRWCLPAVMLNGRDGNVLFGAARGEPVGHPALLRGIPGLPGIGAMVTQVAPGTTRLVATLPGGRELAVRPVRVPACGQSFHLAGFLFTGPQDEVSQLAAYSGRGFAERLFLSDRATGSSLFAASPAGVWASLDKSRRDIAASRASYPIGAGRVAGMTWHIRTELGLFGQCYTVTVRGGHGRSQQCRPVAAPPRTVTLDPVPVPAARSRLAGYAGLVSPRTASVVADFSSGSPRTYHPVRVNGRSYVAIVAPPDTAVTVVSLFDSAGHKFASAVTPVGGSTGTLPMGK